MAEHFKDWFPMSEDFHSLTFNSYSSGQTGGHMPYHLMPPFTDSKSGQNRNLMLVIKGFPSDLTETGVKNFLNRIGCKPSSVKLMYRKSQTALNPPLGFVEFESTKVALKAIELIKSQKRYKLFVCFTSTQTQMEEKEEVMDKEFEEFAQQMAKQEIEMSSNGYEMNANSDNLLTTMRPNKDCEDSSGQTLNESKELPKVIELSDDE